MVLHIINIMDLLVSLSDVDHSFIWSQFIRSKFESFGSRDKKITCNFRIQFRLLTYNSTFDRIFYFDVIMTSCWITILVS